MQRFFLSGQTTCAMLLGAGLLLRAQTALTRPEPMPQARLESPRTRPAELFGERAPRIPRPMNPTAIGHASGSSSARAVNPVTGSPAEPVNARAMSFTVEQHVQNEVRARKGLARSNGHHKVRKCGGVALAGRQFRCG
jgi:hypothetical protein